ncbi:MAG: hypothetical protein GQ582_09790 [Methyloprofundus sp.]|nr:hypothetical protein [Methyloprofundus sp.]
MRNFPEILKNSIIDEEFYFPLVEGDQNTLRLSEAKEGLSVEIKINNSDNIYCFSFDKDKVSQKDTVFPFFNSGTRGLCSKNDYILVFQNGYDVIVFLIELKSTNTGSYLKQLRSGKLFFQFIIDRVKLASEGSPEFDKTEFDKLKICYKGILCHIKRTADKDTSRHKPKDIKVEFKSTPYLDVCRLNYDKVYYLSQLL